MPREIRFRAWDVRLAETDLCRMWYWEEMKNGCFSMFNLTNPEINKGEVILMQYTGLLDKTGKEIYEGDVVEAIMGPSISLCDHGKENYRCDEKKITGTISQKYGGWVVNNDSQIVYLSLYLSPASPEGVEMKIIGNIYENKDLLKEN